MAFYARPRRTVPPPGTDPGRAETRRTPWEVVDAGPFWTGLVAVAYLVVVAALVAAAIQPFLWLLGPALGLQIDLWNRWTEVFQGSAAPALVDAARVSPFVTTLPWLLAASVVAVAVVQVVSSLAGGKRHALLRRLNAYPPLGEEYAATRSALEDMSLAAGLGTPPLYLIDTPAVNAALLAQSPERCSVVITFGMAHLLSADDQRAVFAHLLGRLRYRRLPAVLLLSALLVPVDRLNVLDRSWRAWADLARGGPEWRTGSLLAFVSAVVACLLVGPLIALLGAPILLTLLLVAFLSAVAEQVFHRAYVALAGFGDAEGMMLLKDPGDMLGALERVLAEENGLPYAGTALPMFYCWPKEAPPSVTDPESERAVSLRHTLGAVAHEDPDAGIIAAEEI